MSKICSRTMLRADLAALGLLIGLSGLISSPALACTIGVSATPVVNTTQTLVTVTGVVCSDGNGNGDGITLNYTDATGKPATAGGSLNAIKTATFKITAKSGTKILATDTTENQSGSATAAAFSPPANQVASVYTINPGSSVTLAGNTYQVAGGYTIIDTDVVYDPSSPNFGNESGFLSSVNVTATGAAGTVDFTLDGTPIYTANLAAIWAQPSLPATVSIPTAVELAGTLMVDGMSTPFTGTLSDVTTFFPNGSQTDMDTLSFETDFGPLSGTISASATPELVPEPASLVLLGSAVSIGFLVLSFRTRQLREAC